MKAASYFFLFFSFQWLGKSQVQLKNGTGPHVLEDLPTNETDGKTKNIFLQIEKTNKQKTLNGYKLVEKSF